MQKRLENSVNKQLWRSRAAVERPSDMNFVYKDLPCETLFWRHHLNNYKMKAIFPEEVSIGGIQIQVSADCIIDVSIDDT
jgi:hypothetical protein